MSLSLTARQIVRACRSGALASLDRETGAPYVSFASFAHSFEGEPIFLFSDLSDHTQNLSKNPKLSFLCEQASHLTNPQTGPRVSLTGVIEKSNDPADRALYLKAHAPAQMYADFGDFNFYKMKVDQAHYVGGFGKAHWISRDEYLCESTSASDFYSNQENYIILLEQAFPQIAAYCATKLLKQRGKNWHLLRIDPDGMEFKISSKVVRYAFEKEIKTFQDLKSLISKINPQLF